MTISKLGDIIITELPNLENLTKGVIALLNNLRAEMARYKVSVSDLARLLKCTERTIRNKIEGITPLTYLEAITIKSTYFKDLDMEYLFEQN